MTNARQKILLMVFFLFLYVLADSSAAGQSTVSVNWLGRYHGFDDPKVNGDAITLTRGSDTLRFFDNSRRMEFNGVTIWLCQPVRKKWGRGRILKLDADKTIVPLLCPERFLARKGYSVIVLDAGHGGRDKGVVDSCHGQKEKDLTLLLARDVMSMLRNERVVIHLTRDTDDWIGLDERCARAASFGAELFISIHLNGATNTAASGIETHVIPPAGCPATASLSVISEHDGDVHPGNGHDGANMILGHALQKSLMKHCGGLDRGVRKSRFHVLRNASCPAALVECGFLSNPDEAKKFLDPNYCETVAKAIAEGILLYLNTGGERSGTQMKITRE